MLLLAALVAVCWCPFRASAFSVGGEVTVHGVVPPARFIIMSRGKIRELISNTTEPVIPHVYIGSLKGMSLSYSDSVARLYARFSNGRNFADGVYYPPKPKNQTSSFFNDLSIISWLKTERLL